MVKKKHRNGKIIKWWQENPYCYWCGKKTILKRNGRTDFPNVATFDHIISKLNPKRRNGEIKKGKIVLACYGCNHERAEIEARKLGIIRHWCYSGESWFKIPFLLCRRFYRNFTINSN